MLQARGLHPGGCPEEMNLTSPQTVQEVHREYLSAGADIIETNTFGASSLKLADYGLEDRTYEINFEASRLALEVAKEFGGLVAGSIGPSGKFLEPVGDLSFDEARLAFGLQARAFQDAGVDLIIIETMSDLAEARAAVIGARENSRLPLICQLTFSDGLRTFTGTDAATAVIVLEGLGVDVAGVNCSAGPEQVLPIVEEMAATTRLPISVQPNAGLPELINGRTVYRQSPAEFAGFGPRFIRVGAAIVGGCCGTTPDFIRRLRQEVKGMVPIQTGRGSRRPPGTLALATRTRSFFFPPAGDGNRFTPVLVGERINPTSRKLLSEDIKSGAFRVVKEEALAQVEAGAQVLDVNVGIPDLDEAAAMEKAVLAVQGVVDVPLSIDSATEEVIERGLKVLVGKPIVNSVTGEKNRLLPTLEMTRKYGAAVIGLTLDEEGIPPTAEGRVRVAARIQEACGDLGIPDDDLIIDPLVLTAGAQQDQALETLKAVRLINKELGLRTILGISNVSFGLPNRALLNSAFFCLAVAAGLGAVIANPLDPLFQGTWRALAVLTGKDREAASYLLFSKRQAFEFFPGTREEAKQARQALAGENQLEHGQHLVSHGETSPRPGQREGCLAEDLARAVLEGDVGAVDPLVDAWLGSGSDPMSLLSETLIPAIERVGELFEDGRYFLPQLVASARAMQRAFELLRPVLLKAGVSPKGKVVMATVEGDLHDIGKNIVGLMLENYGFEVVDLGKNVPVSRILESARDVGANIIALSALMTTTMPEMEKAVVRIKEELPDAKIMVGGAVVTRGYADRIGAHGYASDARGAVAEALGLMGQKKRDD